MSISVIIAIIGILLSIFRERESIKRGSSESQSASLKEGAFNFSFSICITLIVIGFAGSFISNKYLPECVDNYDDDVIIDSTKSSNNSEPINKSADEKDASTNHREVKYREIKPKEPLVVETLEDPKVDLNNIYDLVVKFDGNIYKVRKGNYWGLVNSSGKIVSQIKYNKIESLNHGLAIFMIELPYSKTGKLDEYFGAFDENGQIVIDPKYIFLQIQCDVVRASRRGSDDYGYYAGLLSLSGKELFDFEQRNYSGMGNCCNNSFPVSRGIAARPTRAWGAIDSSGKIIYNHNYTLDEIEKMLQCE